MSVIKVQFIGHSFFAHKPTQDLIKTRLLKKDVAVGSRFYARGGAKIEEMDALGPSQGDMCDVAVLHIGGNDVIPRDAKATIPSPWDVKVEILRYAKRVKRRTNAKQIWIVPLHPRLGRKFRKYNRNIIHINSMLQKEVEQIPGISYLRCLEYKDAPSSNYDKLGVHPTGPRLEEYCERVAAAATRFDTS